MQQHSFTLFGAGAGAHEQIEAGYTAHRNPGRCFMLMYAQAVALTQKVVALAVHHFALRLARLLGKLGFLAFDPAQLVYHGQSHSFIIDYQRHGHPHPAIGGIDAQMQVLDVLAHHLDRQSPDVDVAGFSIHAGTSLGPGCGQFLPPAPAAFAHHRFHAQPVWIQGEAPWQERSGWPAGPCGS